MKHLKKYSDHINEMADISRKGKKVFVDDKLMKELDYEVLEDNSVFFYNDKDNFMYSGGKFWLYIVSDTKWVKDYEKGESDMLMFPIRTRMNAFRVAPITDVWKKTHTKNTKNADLIIGIIEGFHDQKTGNLYIEMMSVRPAYKRNSLNAKMMDLLTKGTKTLAGTTVVWEDPTADGLEFIKKYSGDDANFRWTIGIKPKNYKELYPELADETEATQQTGKSLHIGPGIKKEAQ